MPTALHRASRAVTRVLGFAAALCVAIPGFAAALPDYPARPIRLLPPFAPGGSVDALARILTPKLADTMGQPWVIDNRGGGAAAASVLAGEAHVLFGSFASSMPQMKAGRLKAIATTGPRRSPLAPDVPTLIESGYPARNA